MEAIKVYSLWNVAFEGGARDAAIQHTATSLGVGARSVYAWLQDPRPRRRSPPRPRLTPHPRPRPSCLAPRSSTLDPRASRLDLVLVVLDLDPRASRLDLVLVVLDLDPRASYLDPRPSTLDPRASSLSSSRRPCPRASTSTLALGLCLLACRTGSQTRASSPRRSGVMRTMPSSSWTPRSSTTAWRGVEARMGIRGRRPTLLCIT